jgi:hypothetical protein
MVFALLQMVVEQTVFVPDHDGKDPVETVELFQEMKIR